MKEPTKTEEIQMFNKKTGLTGHLRPSGCPAACQPEVVEVTRVVEAEEEEGISAEGPITLN